MKAIGDMLPDMHRVFIQELNVFLSVLQWSFIVYSQIKLYLLYGEGLAVFRWYDVTDAYVAWFITVYLACLNIANFLCSTNTFMTMTSISRFIDETSKKEMEKASESKVSSAFYFKETTTLTE